MINVLVGEMMLDFLIDAKCLQHREKKTKQQNNDLLLLWKHKDLYPTGIRKLIVSNEENTFVLIPKEIKIRGEYGEKMLKIKFC